MKAMNGIWVAGAALLLLPFAAGAEPQSFKRTRGKKEYKRPTAAEALAFLKSLPPVGRKINGKAQMVNEFADKTVADIKSIKTLAPGGHIQGGAHMHLKGDDWRYFTAFESLENANLYEMEGCDDKAFYHLGHLSQTVTRLFVETAQVTDAGVKSIQNLKNLKFLGIGWTKTIGDGALKNMAGIKSLEEINVSGCPGIKGPGLPYLAKLPKLRILHINTPGFGDEALKYLAPLKVMEINMTKPPAWAKKPYKITFKGLKGLLSNRGALPNLKVINLKNAVTAQQAGELQKLRPGLIVKR